MEANVSLTPVYAGFFRRLMANIVDSLIFLAIFQLTAIFITPGTSLSYLVGNTIGGAYYIACLSSPWQATLGKRIMNVYIQMASGGKITVLKAFFRLLASSVPILPLSLLAIFHPDMAVLQEAFKSKNLIRIQQTVHDHAELVTMMNISSAFVLVLMPIWFLPIAFNKQRKGVHDMLCKTRALVGKARG